MKMFCPLCRKELELKVTRFKEDNETYVDALWRCNMCQSSFEIEIIPKEEENGKA